MKPAALLIKPAADRRAEFLAAVRRSRALHRHWAGPPRAPAAFARYLARLKGPAHIGYWIQTEAGQLAGVVNFNEIVRGSFRSAYLGYYAFVPHERNGYMTRGLAAAVSRAFGLHRLHRLEANIQPDNAASKRLVQRLGFRCEGYSPRYLKLTGRWRDHERWAITREEWVG